METRYEELLDTARRAARAGSEVLVPLFRRADLDVSLKRRNDFVSEADRASEEAIVREIRRTFPDHRILAEEGGVHHRGEGSGVEWILDPLDGTTNFVHGHPVWAVSVACRVDGELAVGVISEPLAGNELAAATGCGARWNDRPMRVRERGLDGAFLATGFPFRAHPAVDTYLAAFRDVFLRAAAIRRCGAAALDLAYTAAGIYDAFFELRLSPWDVAAGAVLVREAGGTVTDFDGGEGFLAGGNVVAGAPAVHGELLEVLRRHLSEAIIERLVPQRQEGAEAYTHMQEHARVDGG
jgi:myo-inositol-1(or 4)-monophosphatase